LHIIFPVLISLFIITGIQSAFAQNVVDLYAKLDSSGVLFEVISSETVGDGDMFKKVNEGSLGSGVLVSKDGAIINVSWIIK